MEAREGAFSERKRETNFMYGGFEGLVKFYFL